MVNLERQIKLESEEAFQYYYRFIYCIWLIFTIIFLMS